MSKNLISAGTRVEFREVLASHSLREIDDIFAGGEFKARLDYDPQVSGQRRTLVEQYFANIDLADADDMRHLLAVFEEAVFRLGTQTNDTAAQQKIKLLVERMQRDGFDFKEGRFTPRRAAAPAVKTPNLVALTEEAIAEQIEKARQKIDSDPAGAITNAYTLVEHVIKAVLKKAGVTYKETEGDIRSLYAVASASLNLSPKGESLESYLKAILQGLTSQISGLYEVANKASDRHARKYNPKRHHAQLAVNVAFTLCEFLLASFEYQRALQEKRTNG